MLSERVYGKGSQMLKYGSRHYMMTSSGYLETVKLIDEPASKKSIVKEIAKLNIGAPEVKWKIL